MDVLEFLEGMRRALPRPWRRSAPSPVPAGQSASVAAVITRLQEIDTALDESDGVWQFNRMYLQVTQLVEERLREGFFADETFMTRLDIVFAHLYLDTVQAAADSQPLPPCWEPVFTHRSAPLAPVQFAVAGMNAHINHDLAVAVVTTCRQLGLNPGSRHVRSDYDKVTLLLAEVHEEVRRSLVDRRILALDRELSPLLTLVGTWSVGRARDAAWVNCEVLWHLRRSPVLAEEFRLSLCRSVGLAGRALLTQVAEPV